MSAIERYPGALAAARTAARVRFVYDDAGRPERTGDCATRAVAIALGMPYWVVWRAFADLMSRDVFCRQHQVSSPDQGVPPHVTADCLQPLGWRFHLNVEHLTMHDLEPGRYVIDFRERDPGAAIAAGRGAGHVGALVDGEYHDLFDNTDAPMWGWWRPRHAIRAARGNR